VALATGMLLISSLVASNPWALSEVTAVTRMD
jgi:hypothetical protein